jgi:hypothetical protein
MRRREPIRYASLTSLLDVLFILVFASLIHAAATVERAHGEAAADAEPPPETSEFQAEALDAGVPPLGGAPADAGPLAPSRAQLFEEAMSALAQAIEQRSVTFARVSPGGVLVSIERDHDRSGETMELALGVPLIERVPDSDVGTVYLGERIPELRICTIVRRHLGVDDLGAELVIIVPELPIAELEVALVRGLRRDQERCLRDEGAVGVVVDPLRALRRGE